MHYSCFGMVRTRYGAFWLGAALLVSACASSNLGEPSVDGGPVDGGGPDAATNGPDGGGPDAAPIDAAVDGPDAAPCTPIWNNLLGNASFEAGRTVWTEDLGGSATPIIRQPGGAGGLPFPANDGTWAALILGYNGADVALSQPATVPAGATALRFAGYACWVTTETDLATRDAMTIELRTSGGALLETLASLNDGDAGTVCAWTFFMYPAGSAHAGESVQLVLNGLADGTQPTSFAFDTVSLEALSCP
jgi:hypothetical protein